MYPRPRPASFHPLTFLAKYFDLAEIQGTQRRPIRPEIARLWMAKVSANPMFHFTAIVPRRFTHDREIEAGEAVRFQDGLMPLHEAGRLGCAVMQFPWAFRFTGENREFLIRLRRALHAFPLAAQMRHESWLADEAVGVFLDYHIGFVNTDQPVTARAMPPTALLTTAVGYVRLEGRAWDASRKAPRSDYLYRVAELEEWSARIGRVGPLSSATYVVLANAPGGRSVVNALQMRGILGQAPRIPIAPGPGPREGVSRQRQLFAA
ncbi:MAG: DUF72 domain-containing protein [Bryobacteraceae bacterium]